MHWVAYHAGKITLRQARHLQGLKLAGRKNPKARAQYKREERRLGIK